MARTPVRQNKNPDFRTKAQRTPAAPKSAVPPALVNWVRPEVTNMRKQYDLIDDCIKGSVAVKDKKITYLPKPNPEDTSTENQLRYDAYLTRAVFYNVSQVTLQGFVGSVFEVDPIIRVPSLIEPVVKDADGSGVSLVQLCQKSEGEVLSKGRAGLLIDYPETTGRVVNRKDQMDGLVRPTIHHYHPTDIINWRTTKRGSKTILSLVVLQEDHEEYDEGGFGLVKTKQYRVLRLVNDQYVQELWQQTSSNMLPTTPTKTYNPVDSKGQPLDELPFTFIGAINNDPTIDEPPMFALCDLNLAHYRNSADYEESVYITGQATPVVSGLTQAWLDTVLGGKLNFGSRGGIPLPADAEANLLQMEERTAGFAAMEHKEKQMVALGAKLVETKQVQRTATETSADAANETSTLRTVTDNVAAAYRFALEWCTIFAGERTAFLDAKTAGDDKDAIVFSLNTDFNIATASAEDLNAAVGAWQKEAISYTEMRVVAKRAKMAFQKDETAKSEIQSMRMDDGETDEMGNPIQRQAPIVTAGDKTGGDGE